MDILGLIPARGGSKGIRHKNIVDLNGAPLISYTINAAKKSKFINKIFVSTDDTKISSIVKKYGLQVSSLRPSSISKDTSTTFDVVKYTLNFLKEEENFIPDIIVCLQPTSPLRTTSMIDESINLLINSKASCVLGVKKVKNHPYAMFWKTQNFLKPFKEDFTNYIRRQDSPELYYPTGSIYTFWRKTIEKTNSYYGKNILPYILPEKSSIDIDTKFDLQLAELILKKQI
jgi:CMP-N,N'-diacetyllegionaminic acid synthase